MRIGFDRPALILAAVIIIPLFLLILRRFKPLFALELPLEPPGGIPFKSPVNLKYLMKLLNALELAGVLFLFGAAAGPHVIFSEIVWLNRGADIFFVLDISPSMAGIDMGGRNRFDAARELLLDFADQRPQDAIGLIGVGEDAALLIPLTTDRVSLHERMESLQIGELGDGTALGTGLALGAFHLHRSQAGRRVIVLITDGENNAGAIHPETAAAMIADMGITLWIIGTGSSGDIPFSYVDPATQMFRSGTFDSRYDPAVLSSLAAAAQGHWIHAPNIDSFTAAFAQLDQGEMMVRRSGTIRREEPLHIIFILTAMVLLWGLRLVRRNILGALL
ncbi:MAG: VWA domain-containing protein [Treponema sp.]|nr:VWA domain-containing protein [Treponema sp.]